MRSCQFQKPWLNSCLIWVLIVQLLLPASCYVNAGDSTSPGEDVVAPKVVHEPHKGELTKSAEGQLFSAKVSDNVEVESVSLFYRTVGAKSYKTVSMHRAEDGENYTVRLAPAVIHPPGIEYYIQAKDRAGNASLRGFSFSPLTVTIVAPVVSIPSESPVLSTSSQQQDPQQDKKSSSKKWWWIAGGVLAAVLVAAAAGGGGGGSSDSVDTSTDQQGSLTISAPSPVSE